MIEIGQSLTNLPKKLSSLRGFLGAFFRPLRGNQHKGIHMFGTLNIFDEELQNLFLLYAMEIKKIELTNESILLVMSGQNAQMSIGADLREFEGFNTSFSMSTDYTHITLRSL